MSILENGMEEILAHNERNVSDDLEWAGIASFKFVNNPRSCEGWNEDLNWSSLDRYFSILNYKPEAYQNARSTSMKDWEKQIKSLAGQNSTELKQYYSRILDFYMNVSNSTQNIRGNVQSKPVDDEFVDQLKENTITPWIFSSLPGVDPSSWPYSLPNLIEKLETLPPLMLWLEPFDLQLDLFVKIQNFLTKNTESPEVTKQALKAMLLFAYLSGNGTKLAMAYSEVWRYCSTHEISDDFIEELSKSVAPHVEMIKKIIEYEESIHYVKPGSLMGRFSAAHNSKFQKSQNCWNTSITTDGEYIYLLVSTAGGGKFKIGTGEAGTLSGKVYLYKAIDKAEEAAWTFCKGKLYMKSSFRETGVVSIICPNTFKNEGLLQLYCPDLFGNPQKQILNKYYPLMSDGESLFVVGVKLEKVPQKGEEKKEEEKKEEEKKQEKSEEIKSEEKKDEGIKEEEKIKDEVKNDQEIVNEQKIEEPKIEAEKIDEAKIDEGKIEEAKIEEVKAEEKKEGVDLKNPENESEVKIEEKKIEIAEEVKIEENKVNQAENNLKEGVIEEKKEEVPEKKEDSVNEEGRVQEVKSEPIIEEAKVEEPEKPKPEVLDQKKPENPNPEPVPELQAEPVKADEPLKEVPNENPPKDEEKPEIPQVEKLPENNEAKPVEGAPNPEIKPAEEPQIPAENQPIVPLEEAKILEKAKIVELLKEAAEVEVAIEKPAEPKIEEIKLVEPKKEPKKPEPKKVAEKKAEAKKAAEKKAEEKKAAQKKEEKKEEKKKDDPNLCQFILYKFDMSHLHSDPRPQQKLSELARELYEGFSCYFSMNECQRALAINNDDIEMAATWLIDNGENERGKKIVTCDQTTLLCEATITAYSMGKLQKPEISLKSDTILSLELLSRGEWTMNKSQVTLHFLNPDGGSATARVFSVDPKDVKVLSTDAHVLSNTLNQVGDSKNDSDYWNKYKKEKSPSTYRGSHLCNRDSDKGFAIESVGCYDIVNQKFYVTMLNGNFGVHFTVYADQVSLKERIINKEYYLGKKKSEEFVCEGLKLIEDCELHKFSLPWKWLRWTSVYSKAILRYTKLLKSSIEDEKIKNIQKVVEKLQARMKKLKIIEEKTILQDLGITPLSVMKNKNKKNETVIYTIKEKSKGDALKQCSEKPLISIDNSKESIVTLESTEISLRVLLNMIEIDDQISGTAFHLLFLWITHSRPVISASLLEQLHQVLLKGTDSEFPEIKDLSWKILNIGWESICQSPEKEKFWFDRILEHSTMVVPSLNRKDSFIYQMRNSEKPLNYYMLYKECTDPLLMWYLKHVYPQCLFIPERSYNTLIKENLKVMIEKSSENGIAGSGIISFNPSDSFTPISKRNKFTHLLETSWETFERVLISSISNPSSNATQALFEILIFLCKDSLTEEKNPSEKLAELINSLIQKLCITIGDRITTLYSKWLGFLRNLIIQCISYSYIGTSHTRNLISILSKLKKLFTIEGKNVLQVLCNSFSAGADSSQEKIIETSHPYQRGKQQINETISFPGAIAICIEIDPRSQTDNLHDCLWLSSPENSAGFNNFSGEIYGSSFKLSGKVAISHQLVLQGDQIHIEFNAAGQHREESNSSRWGFRIKIKPLYGEPLLFLSDDSDSSLISKASLRFGGENMLIQWISTYNWLSFTVAERIHTEITSQQPELSEILNWPIFEGGLDEIKIEDFLVKEPNGWTFKEIKLPSPQEFTTESLQKTLSSHKNSEISTIFSGTHKIFALIKEMRKLQGYPERYNAERMRPNFKAPDKKLWENVEAMILYTMLYHTHEEKDIADIIHLYENVNHIEYGYFKDQLRVYARKINEILNWMLRQVQTIKEKQHALEDVIDMKAKLLAQKNLPVEEKKTAKVVIPKKKSNVKRMSLSKPKPKTKKIEKPVQPVKIELDANDKEKVLKYFNDRLSGNAPLIEDLCNSFGIVYEEGTKSINDLFEKIWNQNEDSFPNPYQKIANVVYLRLLILLQFKSSYEENSIAKIQSEIEETSIPILKRAHTEENPENFEKIAEMRKWVDSYKKWKDWKDPKQDLQENSPLSCIYNFVVFSEIPKKLLTESFEQSVTAAKRIMVLQSLFEYLNILNITPGIRLALGKLPSQGPYFNINSCGKVLKKHINEQNNRIVSVLFSNLNNVIQSIKINKDTVTQQGLTMKKESKFLSSQFQYTEIYVNNQLRLIVSLLNDIYLLIKTETYCESVINGLNFEETLGTLVEIFLYASSLSYSKLIMSVSSGVKLIFTAFLNASQQSSSFDFKEKMQQEIMATLLQSLNKEISAIDNPIRLEKLLALTFEIVISTGLHRLTDKIQLTKHLISIILGTSNSVVIRLASRIIKILLKEIPPTSLSTNFVLELFQKIGNYASIHIQGKPSESQIKYTVLLHSPTSEEDVEFLFPVISEWEELYPNNKQLVSKAEEDTSIFEEQVNLGDIYASEILGGLPVDFESLKNISAYNRFYSSDSGRGSRKKSGRGSRRGGRAPAKGGSSKKQGSVSSSLARLEKAFDDSNKAFEDVKEGDTEEEKERKSKEKGFITKYKAIIKECQNIASNLIGKGIAQIGEAMSLDQAIVLSLLIKQHQTQLVVDTKQKLPVLPVNPFAKVPQEVVATEVIKCKKPVQISIGEHSVFQQIDYLMETGPSLPALRSSEKLTGLVTGNYSRPFLHKSILTGSCFSLCIQELLDLLMSLLETPAWAADISNQLFNALPNITEENPISLGALVAYGGWQDIIKPGSNILIENNNTLYKEIVIQGGDLSGSKSCLVLVEEDARYSLKTYQLSELKLANPRLISKISVPHEILANALIKISGTSEWVQMARRQLLLIASQIDWNDWIQSDPPQVKDFIKQLTDLSQQCPTDKMKVYWESKLIQVWEKLADRDPALFISPQEESKSLPSDGFLLSLEDNAEGLMGFTLPASSYLTFHPQLSTSNTDFTNHKMSKYWEKYIIPRIQDYVRSSFKPIEMDYFFAQLRQPLRIGDVHKASEVANVLCDYRLPSGLVLPDQKHDWSALVIDEVVIGKNYIVKITEKLVQQQESQPIKKMQAQGVTQFPVIIRAIDSRAACLLVEFYDHERLELHMIWLPISCIYPSEVFVPSINQIKDLSALFSDFNLKVSAIYSKQILLQCMSAIQKDLIDMMDTMKIACWQELNFDRVEGWRNCSADYLSMIKNYTQTSLQYYIHHPQESQYETPKLNWIEEKVIPGKEPSLVEWCVISWHQLRDEMAESARSIDIAEVATALMGPQVPLPSTPENIVAESNADRKYFPLHFQDSNFCGMVLCFRQEAFLCSNSKLQFFADPEGSELIYEVKAGAQGRGNLSPILFKTGKVWCTYFSFIDIKCSQYNTSFSGQSILDCRVYGIPEGWTLTTWLTEVLSATLSKSPSNDSISLMHSLEDSICEFLEGSHSPTPVRQILFRLLIRIARRMRYMNSKVPTGMGIREDWLAGLVTEMNVLRDSEFTGAGTLYSSYIQDGVELINTLLLPWDVNADHPNTLAVETPDWIKNNFNSLVFLNYFRHEGNLTEGLLKEATDLLKHDQWESIFVLENIAEQSRETLEKILERHKLRIVSKISDIIFFDNKCVIFGDGLSTEYYQDTNFEEEVKVPEVEEENKEAEVYTCDRCTFVNSIDNPICVMCENPKPIIEVKPKIPHIDIRDIENKLIARKKTVFDELIQSLKADLKCEAKLLTDSDTEVLNKALSIRLFEKEDDLRSQFTQAFESIWMNLKDILADDMHKSREIFISEVKSSALSLFKKLEEKGYDLWLQKTLSLSSKTLTRKQLECLTDYIETNLCYQTRASLYLPPSHIRFHIDNISSINHKLVFRPAALAGISIEEIRYNWALIRVFNRYIFDSIGLCNLTQHSLLPRESLTLSVASALSELRALVVFPVKIEVQQHVFALTSVMRESAPKLTLERLKFAESNRKLVNFTKAFEQLKDVNPAFLRPPKPQGADPFISFEVVFKGELVVGEAGPYRQFFADISKEIQNPTSELLCPTPNNLGKSGESVHKYTIKPSKNSLLILQMFEFLGLLMGCCVRTGTRLTLDLPSFFWKPLVGMNLRFDDLIEIDKPAAELLKFMESAPPEIFEESFENFSTKLSDMNLVDLIDNGRNVPVTYENKKEFIKAVLKIRFQESSKQIKALREGLAKVVPIGLLNLITWKQLEEWVCGKPVVDLDLLKKHTKYSGGLTEASQRIVWFWEVLQEFNQEELSKFIKFSWGQERLPSNDEEYSRTHIRLMIKPSMNNENKDGSLPRADTCFFNLEIPDYSSKEILRNKLRYGFLTDCESMNADNPLSEQQEAGMYREEHFSGGEEE